MIIPVADYKPTYTRLTENSRAELRLDKVANEIQITVYSCPLSAIDNLIAKLQELKEETAQAVKPTEPPEMTAVLGPKPDPAAWYGKALQKIASNPNGNPFKQMDTPRPAIVTEPPAAMPEPQKGKGIININGVKMKNWTSYGIKHTGEIEKRYNADIVKGKSIRIYGLDNVKVRYDRETKITTHYTPAFDLTFKVGDYAVHGSYNMVYTGKIVSITDKTVKIDDHGRTHQLDLYTFIRKNCDYDADKIADRNADYMMFGS